MKNLYLKKSMIILAIIVIGVTGFDALITIFAPEFVRRFTYINWFFLVFAIFSLFSPLGRTRFSDEAPEHSTLKWILLTFAMQAFSVLMFVNLLQVAYMYFPYDFFYATYSPPTAHGILKTFFISWGLFPWPLIALIGCLLAVIYYNRNQPALLSVFFPNLKSAYYTLFFKRIINGFLVIETNFAFTISLVVLILVLNLLLVKWLGISNIITIRFGDTLFIILAGLLIAFKILPRLITYSLKLTRNISLTFLTFAIAITLTLTVAHILAEYISTFVGNKTFSISSKYHLEMNWTILFWGYWICWTPFLASFIARISKGRRAFQVILANMILPVVGLLLFMYKIDLHVDWHGVFYNPLFALISPLFVVIFLNREHGHQHLLTGFMPERKNAIAMTMKQGHEVHDTIKVTVILVMTFVVHNLFAIQLLLSLIAIPNVIYFIYCCLAV